MQLGNGTFDLQQNPADVDAGDSLLKLQPPTAPNTLLTISDFFTPYDVFSFDTNGLCPNDEDFGSGGVLLPPNFTYKNSGGCSGSGCSVAITADKQSNIYVLDQKDLGGPYAGTNCASSTNNIQCITTPVTGDTAQGYWASPAYWYDGTHYWLYYSATMNGSAFVCPYNGGQKCQNGYGPPMMLPEALNAYQLQTSGSPGPIPSATPYASSSNNPYPILFCDYSPTPSVSSNPNSPAGSGIVWAIEQDQNKDNNPKTQGQYQDCAPPADGGGHPFGNPVALHAFNATTMAEIYSSRTLSREHQPGLVNAFPTPTVFNGQVYIGTNTEIDVFGLCSSQSGGCLQ